MWWFLLGIVVMSFRAETGSRAHDVERDDGDQCRVVEDFEDAPVGGLPSGWVYLNDRRLKPLQAEFMHPNKKFTVEREGGNRFVRAHTESESQHIMLTFNRGAERRWDLDSTPVLAWRWRVLDVPPGASEDKLNDTAAAVYVTFDKKDWLGRPRSIKYTYSSTLPVGTVVSSGNLRVIVAASDVNGDGTWTTAKRNVRDDYRGLFGKGPPQPVMVTLWSDSDDTRSVSEADFDDLRLCGEIARADS